MSTVGTRDAKQIGHRLWRINMLVSFCAFAVTVWACSTSQTYRGARSNDEVELVVNLRPSVTDRLRAVTDAGDVFIHSIAVDEGDIRNGKVPFNFGGTHRLLLSPGRHSIRLGWGRDWNMGLYYLRGHVAERTFQVDAAASSRYSIDWVYVGTGGEPSTDGKFKLELRPQ